MAAVISWTKSWSSSDDGTVFGGADLQNIQTNISTYCVTLAGSQTLTGDKTFSGTTTFTGSGLPILLSTSTVSFAANADTTLYTVPTGKRCVLSFAIVVAGADAGATTTIAIGADGAETNFIPANTLSNLDAQYDAVILMPIPNTTPLKSKSYAAATVIQAQVATQSGGTTNTVYLFGFLY
jgi:hypothetical protein